MPTATALIDDVEVKEGVTKSMRHVLPLAAAIAIVAASPAEAAVTYSFATDEPFAGGTLAFTYEAPAFVSDTGFIEASSLTGVVGNIQRVRFQASCPLLGSPTTCDQLTVIAGNTSASRYFTDGTFSRLGTANASVGTAATLRVAEAAAGAVPEPATWGLMLAGFGLAGTAMRRRRTSSVTYA